MYNRYIPKDAPYEAVSKPSHSSGFAQNRTETRRPPPPSSKGANPLDGIIGGLGGLLKQIHFDRLDSGDLLLILILIFLFLEREDNLELVITLGLLLVLGLFNEEDDSKD